ncbi:site-specific integrase [Microbacterium sp. NPDC076768]|uniref:tyrosine-type recombinase/integrase n=1 Tax=Microbacterium sp. NPDC076768 TaxID=3154858 RepID=UPI003426D64A
MAFVRKNEAGRFRGVAKRGRVLLGTRTFDRRKDALAWAERLEAAADGGVDVRAGKALVRDLLPEWIEYRRKTVTPQAATTDAQLIRLMSSALGARSVASILSVDIERWLVGLRDRDLSDASIKRYRTSLSSFFAACVAVGRRQDNPVRGARLPSVVDPPAEMCPFSESELAVTVAKVRERSEHLADVVVFFAETGLRWGEARELRRRDLIELPIPSLRVARSRSEGQEASPTKGRTARTVPLTDRAHTIVKRLILGKGRDDLLLTGENGGQLWRSAFLRSSGYTVASDNRRIYDLRHTFATLAIAKGVDLATLSKYMGHADVSVTSRNYVHYQGSRADLAALALLNGGGGAPGVRDDESEAAG